MDRIRKFYDGGRVSFSIDHTAAVTVPVALGFLWATSPAMIFIIGGAMAAFSLLLACNVPVRPSPSNETLYSFGRKAVLEGDTTPR